MTKRTAQVVEAELRKTLADILACRDLLQGLDQKRLALVAEYRAFSQQTSSVTSSEKFGQPGVIQTPPPGDKDGQH